MIRKVLRNRKNPFIKIVKEWKADESGESAFYAPGVLIQVKDGKGILREVFGESGKKTYLSLMFGDEPLFGFQGEEYFCPTCEKIMRSGYGLEQEFHLQMDKINQSREKIPLMQAVLDIFPLMGLLPSGFYAIVDTKLHPTDGNGHFFWDIPNNTDDDGQFYRGTCLYQFDDFKWGSLRPYFTVATQPKHKCNMQRVEYYRHQPGCRVVAYYMDGYMTALLDGHHKAFAAAMDNTDVNALVIIPGYLYTDRQRNVTGCRAADLKFSIEDLGINQNDIDELKNSVMSEKISEKEVVRIQESMKRNNRLYDFPVPVKNIADNYPSVEEQAYIDRAGIITDALLNDILCKKVQYSEEEVIVLMKGLSGLKHPRFWEMGEFFCGQCQTGKAKYLILKKMMELPKNEEREQFFIDKMVELEQDYPDIKNLILDYL